MISLRGRRVFARAAPTDLREGYSGLAALVGQELGHDLVAGDVFVFVSRDRRSARSLLWDGTGLCIVSKRLARGRFAALWGRVQGGAVSLSQAELRLPLRGRMERVELWRMASQKTKSVVMHIRWSVAWVHRRNHAAACRDASTAARTQRASRGCREESEGVRGRGP